MTQPLRWGILGVAAINDRLLPAFRASQTADLRAIASRSAPKARDAAAKAGFARAHRLSVLVNLAQMLVALVVLLRFA